MSAALDTTAAVARAQSAFANAGAAMASLAQTVVDAHRESEREMAGRLRDLERRERDLERQQADAEKRIADVERREAALISDDPHTDALRKAYRRGYETGFQRGRSGRPADVERALQDKRNALRVVA
jgi:hypothetical protein